MRINKRIIFQTATVLLCAALMLLSTVMTVSLAIKDAAKDRISDVEGAESLLGEEKYDCILVLGAGLKSDGSPSDMLADRVTTGAQIFALGAADKIIMSGDRSGETYDEPTAMKKFAEELGVSTEHIVTDFEGYSTYESIYRAKKIYGAERIIIVTQKYHLSRALYIAKSLDIEAVGVSADLRGYRGQIFRDVREVLARFKDFILPEQI